MGRTKNKRVAEEAKKIVRQLRKGGVTIRELCTEYNCHYYTLMKAILEVIDFDKWRKIVKKQHQRGGAKGGAKRKANKERKEIHNGLIRMWETKPVTLVADTEDKP
jgi:lambda repressor-like predicted transcriptional regulator